MFSFCNIKLKIQKRLFIADFQLPTRGIVFLEGENGSGKSTLLKCLMGYRRYKGNIVIDDQNFKGRFFSKRTKIRTNISYLTPDSRDEFIGIKFSTLFKHNPNELVLDLITLIDFPTETDYELLSSGERSLFHLAYALLYPRSVLILDELLSSLSAKRLDQLIPFFDQLKKSSLLIVTSQKSIEGLAIDVHYLIKDQRVETIFAPEILDDTTKILRYDYKKTKTITLPKNNRFLKYALIDAALIICLFGSFSFIYNDYYSQYREELGRTHYFDLSSQTPSFKIKDQTRTVLKMQTANIKEYEYLRFIASENPGYTKEAVSYFNGVMFADKEASLQSFMREYFNINLSNLRNSIPLNDKKQIFVTEQDLSRIQTMVLYECGEFLSPDIKTLIGDPRVNLLAGMHDLPYYVEKEEIILLGSEYPSHLSPNLALKKIGYVKQVMPSFGPVVAYTNVSNYERYTKERLFALPYAGEEPNCVNLTYFQNPKQHIRKLSFHDLRIIHDKITPRFTLPLVFAIFFILVCLTVVFQKKKMEESIYLESGAPLWLRLLKNIKPTIINSIIIAVLFCIIFSGITFTTILGSISLLYALFATVVFTPFVLLIYLVGHLIRQQIISKVYFK